MNASAGSVERNFRINLRGRMKTKRPQGTKLHSKLPLKLSAWASYIDEAYQLEALLAKKPARLQIANTSIRYNL